MEQNPAAENAARVHADSHGGGGNGAGAAADLGVVGGDPGVCDGRLAVYIRWFVGLPDVVGIYTASQSGGVT